MKRDGSNPSQFVVESQARRVLGPILDSLKLKSLDRVEDLKTLEKIVLAMEAKAGLAPNRT